jgi:hypothetical protein
VAAPVKRWVVRVYWESAMPDEEAARVRDRLHGHSPVVNRHPIDRVWEATISLRAATLERAVAAASELVAEATELAPIGVEVLREHVVDPRVKRLPPSRSAG